MKDDRSSFKAFLFSGVLISNQPLYFCKKSSVNNIKKILVVQTAFIGDVILATALLEKLHQFYPEAKLDFLVRKGNEILVEDHPYLHNVLVFDKRNGKYKNLWKLIRQIRGEQYDVLVNVQRFATTGLLTVFSGAKMTIGFDKNPLSLFFSRRIKHEFDIAKGLHEVERNQRLIEDLTDPVPAKPRLYPSVEVMAKVKKFKREPYICISPSSVWYTKQFPQEKWIEFIKTLPGDLQIYLLGAPDDSPFNDKIRTALPQHNILNLAGKINLIESAALIEDAQINYVNDSAPMHLASATNAPVVAVYCSTVPAFGYGPLSDLSTIVENNLLDCRPCGLHGHKRCPKGHFKCAKDIDVAELTGAYQQFTR